MAVPTVTDDDRDELAAALAAAILLIYTGSRREANAQLGTMAAPEVTVAERAKIDTFAAERAQLVQTGINTRLTDVVNELGDEPSEDEMQAAVATEIQRVAGYHRDTLIPFVVSWAYHQGLVDTYQSTASSQPGKTAAEVTLWTWTQHTDYDDDCMEADAASPATLSDLLAITEGPPPAHSRCHCDLNPAS